MQDSIVQDRTLDTPFRVTDLKQWVYCARILYYYTCLPDIRPVTYKMETGIQAGREEAAREVRRSLKVYKLTAGRREFDVPVASSRLGLRGKVDMVIWLDDADEQFIPVDYKHSKENGLHVKFQLAAYALLLEEMSGGVAKRGFLYSIPLRKAEEVKLDKRLRQKLYSALEGMHRMLLSESMPAPTPQRSKCVACEFRRFCNDVM